MIDFDIILRPNMTNYSVDTTPNDFTNITPYYNVESPWGWHISGTHTVIFVNTQNRSFLAKTENYICNLRHI